LEVTEKTISADPSLIILTKGLFSVAIGLFMFITLYRLSLVTEPSGTHEETSFFVGKNIEFPVRIFAWSIASLLILAPLLGYVDFSTFLETEAIIIALCYGLFIIGWLIVDEGLSPMLNADAPAGHFLLKTAGISEHTLVLTRILSISFLRIILAGIAIAPILTSLGIELKSIFENLKKLLIGIKVGELTISPFAILIAFLTFIICLKATRALQQWLSTQILPSTSLDAGLQHSIKTIFGYIGITFALILGLFQLGFGLDKLAILLAGLSVGIGFGLKTIVENFVSGLILLLERFIRIGDKIRVESEEGIVTRIAMRSTEIETSDNIKITIPNTKIVDGIVKNWGPSKG
jgi:small-conductance mechanosensitive channel